MSRLRLIFLSLGLSFLVRGQQIANYVSNGSFEEVYSCAGPIYPVGVMKGWSSIDSSSYAGTFFSVCNNYVPLNGNTYQFPCKGKSHIISTIFIPSQLIRGYPRNRMKLNLEANHTYCAKFYVNIANTSPYGMDGFGAYFGGSSIDTITKCNVPLVYLTPQIQNLSGNVITDTLNWVPISGTFTAMGDEKYMLLGNFLADNAVSTTSIGGPAFPQLWTDVLFDYASCIDIELPAYAGPDKWFMPGDSIYIGRESDVEIDESCIWYLITSATTSVTIDTIAGVWVKPVATTTYVVRQQLWCSSVKWDTVVVFMDAVGLKDLQWYSDNINLFPNPTETDLTITFGSQADISKISIINSIGQTIREEDLQIQKTEFTVSTSDLDKGIYLIQFKTSAGTVTKQFVKN